MNLRGMAIIRKTLQPDLGQATPDVNPIDMVGCPKERQAVLNFFPTVRRVALRGLMCYFSWGVGHGFFLTTQNWGKPLGIGFHQQKLEFSHEPIRLQKPRTLVELVFSAVLGFRQVTVLFWVSLPSGKHTKSYGKSPFLMGKSTINGPFSIAMLVYQRVPSIDSTRISKRFHTDLHGWHLGISRALHCVGTACEWISCWVLGPLLIPIDTYCIIRYHTLPLPSAGL